MKVTRTDLHRCYSPISFTVIRMGLPVMLKEYGLNYEKRHTKQGIQTNLTLKEESYGDWLPKCDDPATA
ncbi:poxvirus D5 -like family protein [Escherichia coli]|nr:poxvirus D5 -like family protein [Escherichia coli]